MSDFQKITELRIEPENPFEEIERTARSSQNGPSGSGAKRGRRWESTHTPKHYRGVPADLRNAVKQLAEFLDVTVDDVARALFEYSLACIAQGNLRLEARINHRKKAQKMTLFPFTGAGWAVNGWNPVPPPDPSEKPERPQPNKRDWEEMAHYRIPDALHTQLKKIAGIHFPLGEVASVLLKHGLEAYRTGVLVLTPQPRTPD